MFKKTSNKSLIKKKDRRNKDKKTSILNGSNYKKVKNVYKDEEEILSDLENDTFNGEMIDEDTEKSLWTKNKDRHSNFKKIDINLEEEETLEMKKLRLTKEYLSCLKEKRIENIENEVDNINEDSINFENNYISKQIDDDLLKMSGLKKRFVATKIKNIFHDQTQFIPFSKGIVTCFTVSNDDRFIFIGYKSGCLKKIDLDKQCIVSIAYSSKRSKKSSSSKVCKLPRGHVLCISITTDSKYLASSNEDCSIHIWNACDLKLIKSLEFHRGYVTSLAFQIGSYQLYSGSKDKSVKIWSLNDNQMTYVDSLFGHEETINDMSCLNRERLVTCGGIDKSIRYWKIPEATQLVFLHSSYQECVKLVDETNFISTTDDGIILKWNTSNKKPVFTLKNAHNGLNNLQNNSCSSNIETPIQISSLKHYWITSLAVLSYGDVCATGSHDGYIKIWSINDNFKLLSSIKLEGIITNLLFIKDGQYLLIGVSRETRLGRWLTVSPQSIQEGVHMVRLFD